MFLHFAIQMQNAGTLNCGHLNIYLAKKREKYCIYYILFFRKLVFFFGQV